MSLMERLERQKKTNMPAHPAPASGRNADRYAGATPAAEEYADLKQQVHAEVIDLVNRESGNHRDDDPGKKEYIRSVIESVINLRGGNIPRSERGKLIGELYNDIVGLGPLEALLADPEISEIMVNGPDHVYVETRGKIRLTNVKFRDDLHVMNVINRIVASVGRRIDEASPMVDARLADGSRVNAIIPPCALSGPTITIRKFSATPLTVADLIRFGSVSPQMVAFLEACVKARLNIVVSGGTGSGKTTLLSVLSAYIPEDERIVTIEDAAELQLRQEHVITLESKPANVEGSGAVTIRDLVRNALRMRPDRIVVGEVRSGETLDMLQAMNTGHDGSLSTGHANSTKDMLSRLETMVLTGADFPIEAIRQQIGSAIDLIVHLGRLSDKSRKTLEIVELAGFENGEYQIHTLFKFEKEGVAADGKIIGRLNRTNVPMEKTQKFEMSGIRCGINDGINEGK